MNLKDCLEKGYLIREEYDVLLVNKEIQESHYDFNRAVRAFEEKDYKWAIIQSYYSMFHAVKALCFRLGFREKKHIALVILLEHLTNEGKLESKFVHY